MSNRQLLRQSNILFEYATEFGRVLQFNCPGCGVYHSVDVRTDGIHPQWQFNENMDRPSFTPSVHYPRSPVCHFYVTDGQLIFGSDCEHELKGQTVPMEPM